MQNTEPVAVVKKAAPKPKATVTKPVVKKAVPKKVATTTTKKVIKKPASSTSRPGRKAVSVCCELVTRTPLNDPCQCRL